MQHITITIHGITQGEAGRRLLHDMESQIKGPTEDILNTHRIQGEVFITTPLYHY